MKAQIAKELSASQQMERRSPPCGMTVQPQDSMAYDETILRTIVREADQCLGVGAHGRASVLVQVGDTVELLD